MIEDRFKIRACSTEHNRMVDWDYIIRHKEVLYSIMGDESFMTNPVRPLWIRMQCTGLLDENGKLIFEGDIVIVTEPERNGMAPFVHSPVVVTDSDESAGFCLGYYSGTMTIYNDYEIIGNIHENPEPREDNNE